jgi:hypothetical protein
MELPGRGSPGDWWLLSGAEAGRDGSGVGLVNVDRLGARGELGRTIGVGGRAEPETAVDFVRYPLPPNSAGFRYRSLPTMTACS